MCRRSCKRTPFKPIRRVNRLKAWVKVEGVLGETSGRENTRVSSVMRATNNAASRSWVSLWDLNSMHDEGDSAMVRLLAAAFGSWYMNVLVFSF